jgi:hypothetical protein
MVRRLAIRSQLFTHPPRWAPLHHRRNGPRGSKTVTSAWPADRNLRGTLSIPSSFPDRTDCGDRVLSKTAEINA